MVLYVKYNENALTNPKTKNNDVFYNVHDEEYLKIISANLYIVASQMLNIEYNKYIFDINGVPINPDKQHQTPFNEYTYKRVDFNILPNRGVIIIYSKTKFKTRKSALETIITTFLRKNIQKLEKSIAGKTRIQPITTRDASSTQHCIIETSINPNTTNKRHIGPYNSLSSRTFTWEIEIVDSDSYYLNVPEMNSVKYTESYLYKSISTIILDIENIFNMSNGQKQLNYPSLGQYNMYDNDQVIQDEIIICDIKGIYTEIINCFTDKKIVGANMILNTSTYYRHITIFNNISEISYNDVKARRINPNKPWYIQINDEYDYDKQEKEEENSDESGKPPFYNNRCYLSQLPLFDEVYVLKVKAKNKNSIPFHIFITPYIYQKLYSSKKNVDPFYLTTSDGVIGTNFIQYFELMCDCEIKAVYRTKFPRTALDVISIIPDTVCKKKKYLLYTIEKFGICVKNGDCVIFNPETNVIYRGHKNIYDGEMLMYNKTKTILFKCIHKNIS